MGAESNMRGRIVKILRSLDACSVENPACPGFPDIDHVYGNLELKQVPGWPVKGGPLAVDHFRPEQRIWLRKRVRAGGQADLLIRVASDWLVLPGDYAADRLGLGAAKDELIKHAIDFCWRPSVIRPGDYANAFWADHLSEEGLLRCQARNQPR